MSLELSNHVEQFKQVVEAEFEKMQMKYKETTGVQFDQVFQKIEDLADDQEKMHESIKATITKQK